MELTDFEDQMIDDIRPILRSKARAARQLSVSPLRLGARRPYEA